MIITRLIEVVNEEIEEYIEDEVIDTSLNNIENWLLDKYGIENSDLGSPEYISFLNIMKKKIDERIAKWVW